MKNGNHVALTGNAGVQDGKNVVSSFSWQVFQNFTIEKRQQVSK